MRRVASWCLATIVGGSAFAAAACENPAMVTIPDGKSATREQLLDAQTSVKTYMAAMDAYIACIDEEASAKGETAPADYKAMMIQRHNMAVTEMETVAAAFNDQVKAYRAANPAPPAATN
jgi:hypothetical protein